MNFESYLTFLKKIASSIPFALFDYVMVVLLALYAFEDASFGLISAGVGFASTLLAFFVGLLLYHPLSQLIVEKLALPKGISDALAFLFVTVVSFFIISFVLSYLRKKYISIVLPKRVDEVGGAIFGFLSFFFVSSFAVALLLSFPVSNVVKDSIRNSVTGKYLFSRTQVMESYVRQVFGGAIEDTINFMTIEPSSNGTIALNFKTDDYKVDKKSELEMLADVNKERSRVGLSSLIFDEELAKAARKHAADMLARGYFSHYTPEGLSPFDRMGQAGITYGFAGENLAFAPDVSIAMSGLMKSPGHKENILSSNFRKAGIGVLDAGIFGKIFVQEFND